MAEMVNVRNWGAASGRVTTGRRSGTDRNTRYLRRIEPKRPVRETEQGVDSTIWAANLFVVTDHLLTRDDPLQHLCVFIHLIMKFLLHIGLVGNDDTTAYVSGKLSALII